MATTISVARNRVLDLIKVQCQIFNTIFNPTGARQGTKILRQRLKGPSVATYYPRRMGTMKDLMKAFPGFETYSDKEEERLESLALRRMRGKQAPKKKRSAAESKKFAKRK
jgi:hypothetical protein